MAIYASNFGPVSSAMSSRHLLSSRNFQIVDFFLISASVYATLEFHPIVERKVHTGGKRLSFDYIFVGLQDGALRGLGTQHVRQIMWTARDGTIFLKPIKVEDIFKDVFVTWNCSI